MKKKTKWILGTLLSAAAVAAAGLWGFSLYGAKQMEKIPALTAEQCLQYTLKDRSAGCITVGILKDGAVTYHMYGENGAERPLEPHTYEIGSITKTMTAALVEKAVLEGKISLEEPISTYLGFEGPNAYPSIRSLLTHTSGCRPWYFCGPMAKNYFAGGNSFRGITGQQLYSQAEKLDLPEESYPWEYSNFGISVLGLTLEQVNGEPFSRQLTALFQDLDMKNTRISDGTGDLEGYWQWEKEEAYLPAGAVVSDIQDMMHYASLQLEGRKPFGPCHEKQIAIEESNAQWEMMGLHADAMGLGWILDEENGFVWHNGATSEFNSYLGFCPSTDTAVVVLSNLPPSFRIPATIIGPKILKELQ